jgi:hypothetical protein
MKFDQIPKEAQDRNRFKVQFYVTRIEPDSNWREIVQMHCPNCNKTVSCSKLTSDVNYCEHCEEKHELKPIFMMQMLVKDETSQTNKNFYRILLYSTVPDRGESFFGEDLTPSNLYRDEKKCKKIV